MSTARPRRVLPALLLALPLLSRPAWADLPKVPEGFGVRLVATVPAVEYPCQLATAPDGALYVAEDPMDQVGPYEAYDGRILLFRDGKDPVVFAEGFRAIFGMAWHDGSLYVSHMPFLTVLKDNDGDGKADGRKDLFKDLGQTANRGLNDHIVSGLQFGIDGFLYIATGDKGIPRATGPDGRTIQVLGGGVCRCRPDGTGIEVVSTGTRNHLEPNLDDRDNIFTYDNTDDGDGWWTRVTHHIDSGYFGYPYDYHDRPDRMLPRMAEYGGGSPCGALIYKEDAWPEAYRGVGFWAEWGKGKVHAFRFAPDGSTFKVAEAIDFATPDGLKNFRPIDLALSYDGKTLYIADWNMGGWGSKQEKVGRVFAVTYNGEVKTRPRGNDSDSIDAQIAQLDHPSFNERMRAQAALIKQGRAAIEPVVKALDDPKVDPVAKRHLVWVLGDRFYHEHEGAEHLERLLKSPVADVRAQAVRALGLGHDATGKPQEGLNRLAMRMGLADALIPLASDPDPPVRLQVVIALGRIASPDAVPALLPILAEKDVYLAFAARQALRRIGDWKETAEGLKSADPKVRTGVLAAMELVYDPGAASALAGYAGDAGRPVDERTRALMYLAQGHRKTKPWDGKWWGTRPTRGKPPAKVDDWEGTPVVLGAVRSGLADPLAPVRLAAVSAVVETNDRDSLPTLRARFAADDDEAVRRSIAEAFGTMEDKAALPVLIAAVRDPKNPESVRAAALAAVEDIGTDLATTALVELLQKGDLPAERQPKVIAALGRFKAKSAVPPLVAALQGPDPAVRVAAVEALGMIGQLQGVAGPVRALLDDPSTPVREAAATTLGTLGDRESIPALLKAAEAEETRYEAGMALAAMPDMLAFRVYLRNLGDKSPDLRKAAVAALVRVRDQAAPVLEQLAVRREVPSTIVPELRKVFTVPRPLVDWHVAGPFPFGDKPPFAPNEPIDPTRTFIGIDEQPVHWRTLEADGQGLIDLNVLYPQAKNAAAFGHAEFVSPEPRDAQLVLVKGVLRNAWVNGRNVYNPGDRRVPQAVDSRVEIRLNKGANRIVAESGRSGRSWQFALAVTVPADYAFLKAPAAGEFNPEDFRAFAIKAGKADPAHGRALFTDLKGLACIKCHTVGAEGGKVGPEMSTIGSKYPRDELITSVLYPSQRISSGYEPVVIALSDGRILTGIVKNDTPEGLEIEDADAKLVKIPKADIDERRTSDVSLMPNGLVDGLKNQDFADLIAFLESLKEVPAQPPAGGRGR